MGLPFDYNNCDYKNINNQELKDLNKYDPSLQTIEENTNKKSDASNKDYMNQYNNKFDLQRQKRNLSTIN